MKRLPFAGGLAAGLAFGTACIVKPAAALSVAVAGFLLLALVFALMWPVYVRLIKGGEKARARFRSGINPRNKNTIKPFARITHA